MTFFTSISNVDDTNATLPNLTLKTQNKLENIKEQDVLDVLSILTINKASGPDEISHRMLKETRHTICKPLTIQMYFLIDLFSYVNTQILGKKQILFLYLKKETNLYLQIIDQFLLSVVLVK